MYIVAYIRYMIAKFIDLMINVDDDVDGVEELYVPSYCNRYTARVDIVEEVRPVREKIDYRKQFMEWKENMMAVDELLRRQSERRAYIT